MNQESIKETQKRIKDVSAPNLIVDGYWGAISTKAARNHLLKMMPKPNPFPTQSQIRAGNSIYGKRGVKDGYAPPMTKIIPPYEMLLYGEPLDKVKHIFVHEKCAGAFELALTFIKQEFSSEDIKYFGLNRFFGVYNPRSIRGGSVASMHAFACAMDLDANRNKNSSHWPTAAFMPIEAMECFAKAGIIAAGVFWNRDAMHFEASNPVYNI